VYIVLDENLEYIKDEYYIEPIYFAENGIARVNRVCSVAYMNYDGEYIWYDDSEY